MDEPWQIVLDHQGLIKYLADKAWKKYPTLMLDYDDYLNMTYMAAYEAAKTWNPNAANEMNLVTFLSFRTKQRLIDQLRKDIWSKSGWNRHKDILIAETYSVEMNQEQIDSFHGFETPDDPDNYVEWSAIIGCFDSLTNKERFILFHLLYDKPKQEIAKELGVSPGRVSQILNIIEEKLIVWRYVTEGSF